MRIENRKILLLCTFLFVVITGFLACKKEISESNAGDEKKILELLTNSNNESFQVFDDVYNNIMGVNSEVAVGGTGIFGRIITVDSSANPCYVVKITRLYAPSLFPVEVDLDFGNGCLGKDGMYRKGNLNIVYTGPLTRAGSIAQATFNNFYINDVLVEGSYRIENISISQQLIYQVVIKDGKLTKPNSNYSIWNSINTTRQVEGSGTPGYAKDDVLSSISASDVMIKSDSIFLIFNSKTIEPLIKKFTCHWIVKGKTEIMKSSTGKAIIDFGDGDCDDKANLIINTSTTEITLH